MNEYDPATLELNDPEASPRQETGTVFASGDELSFHKAAVPYDYKRGHGIAVAAAAAEQFSGTPDRHETDTTNYGFLLQATQLVVRYRRLEQRGDKSSLGE